MNNNTRSLVLRALNLFELIQKKLDFLFRPRQTRKSFLISHLLKGVSIYNLLDTKTFLQLNQNPDRMAGEMTKKGRIVVLDEIQRLPELLFSL